MTPEYANKNIYSAGFTLLELLISLSLLALIFTFLSSSFTFGKRVWDVSHRLNETAIVPVVQDFLRHKIRQTMPILKRGNQTNVELSFSGKDKQLDFIGIMNAQTVKAGLYQFSLYKADTNLKLRLTLFRPNQQSAQSQPSSYDRVLLENIKDIKISYYGQKSRNSQPEWHKEWQSLEVLPDLVRIDVIFPKRDPRSWPDFIISPLLKS